MKATVALVQGDAAGIGAELLAKLLDDAELRNRANILVVSDERVFRAGCEVAGLDPPVRVFSGIEDVAFDDGVPVLLDVVALDLSGAAERAGGNVLLVPENGTRAIPRTGSVHSFGDCSSCPAEHRASLTPRPVSS